MNAQRLGLLAACGEAGDAALRGRHRDADPVRLACDVESGVGLRHASSGDGELREAIEPAQAPLVEPPLGIELVGLARDPHGMPLRRERGDRARAAVARDEPAPRRLDVRPERRHRTEAGHDNAPLGRLVIEGICHRGTDVSYP